jgi:acetylornithine deacetylase/succinyl-diaminopimelate desuccinylase-like protein
MTNPYGSVRLALPLVLLLHPAQGCGTGRREPPAPSQSRIAFTTNERFDARAVPPYAGEHRDVYAYIESHRAEHLEQLQRWLRQPSISAEGKGIREMANLVRQDLTALGFQEAELVPTSGHPGVWGYLDQGAPKTLLVYMMYDVQPVEQTDWQVNAFEGAVIDHQLGRVLMARGATNQKGPERAFLNAVGAIRAVRGKLPVNLMIAAEGEEELGSPHYPEVIDRYQARMRKADGVMFPSNSQGRTGEVTLSLGVKGILYLELEAQGGEQGGPTKAEIHGSLKVMTDAPAWRLVQALATLTTPDGNTVTIPGYYDRIRPPSDEEQRLVNARLEGWGEEEQGMRTTLAVKRWTEGLEGRELLARMIFGTTLNIDGLVAGYTGPGVKTILPHRAVAKIDTRLVPNQTPEEALRLIRSHLAAKGFEDVSVKVLSSYPPAQTSVDEPWVRAAIAVLNKYGKTPVVSPRGTGSAPYYVFTQRLGLPMVSAGLGHGSGAHAPNEYMVVEPGPGSRIASLSEMEKFYADLLYAFAGTP